MIEIICGNKGSGKTKKLLDRVQKATEESKGNIIYIDNCNQHTFELSHKVRLVNVSDYHVNDYQQFEGFIAGMLAGNYDITDIYVDGILRIVGRDLEKLGNMIENIEKFSKDVRVCFTISAEKSALPDGILKYEI